MSQTLIQNIRKRMDKSGLKTRELEKKAGLKVSAVQNILHGRSKKPSSDTLLAIAEVFGCTIEELLAGVVDKNDKLKEVNCDLWVKSTSFLIQELKDRKISITEPKLIHCIKEVYRYSLLKNEKDIDTTFIEWFIEKTL